MTDPKGVVPASPAFSGHTGAARAVRHNVPVFLTSFIGRESQITSVRALLHSHRLVTIVGPGGAGKTRLAREVAATFCGGSTDGPWWVDLAELADPDVLPYRIARSAGLQPSMTGEWQDEFVAMFSSRSVVLVLDNCEHIAEHVANLAEVLLRSGPGLRILATSRMPPRAEGELAWPIPPLSLATGARGGVEPRAGNAAVALFISRAQHARFDLCLDDDGVAADVADICRRLDGLPLAIELAAARTRSLSIARIRHGLMESLDLLTNQHGRGIPRHLSMQASLDWSHSLLADHERVVLRRLSVFAGSFTLEDAVAVVASGGPPADVDALDTLVGQSLVAFDDAVTGPERYRLPGTVRHYSLQCLVDAGERDNFRQRHAERFACLARELGRCLQTAWDDSSFKRLAAELDNLELAMRTFTASGAVARTVTLLWDTQLVWGLMRPASADGMISRLLEGAGRLDGGDRAKLHLIRAIIRGDAGAMVEAVEPAAAAVAGAEAAGEEYTAALAHAVLASMRVPFDPLGAEPLLRKAGIRCQDLGDVLGQDIVSMWLGVCVGVFQGSFARGVPILEDALTRTGVQRNPLHSAWVHCVLGEMYAEHGALPLARDHADQVASQLGRVAQALPGLGGSLLEMSVPGSVAALVSGYVAILQDQEPFPGVDLSAISARAGADGFSLAAYVYRFLRGLDGLRRRDAAGALEDLSAAEGLAEKAGGWFTQNTRLVKALAELAGDDPAGAAMCLDNIDPEALTTTMLRSRWRIVQADVALYQGDAQMAEELALEVLGEAVSEGFAFEIAQLLEVLARTRTAAARHSEAVRLAAAATRLRAERMLRFGPPVHLDPVDEVWVRAKKELGAPDAVEAWRQGWQLDPVQAMDYARRARGHRRRHTFGWSSLTPTERHVARLVAAGHTNSEVASRLFVSPETVKTHLNHVFAKLGVRSRAQVAAAAVMNDPTSAPPSP